jgi:spermidine/putrescine-binding protein
MIDPRMQKLMSRRAAIGAGLGSVASLYLAACGGSSGGGGAASTATAAADLSKKKLEDSVLLYNWAEYDDPSIFARFTEQVGPKADMEFYGSTDELNTKLRAGGTSYDAACVSGTDVQELGARGVLLELDHELLPNLANLQTSFTKMVFDPGNKFTIANDYGLTSFYYRTDVVTDPPATLKEWFEVLPEYKGKNINFLSGAAEIVPLALAALDLDVNSENPDEYDAALELLLPTKEALKTVNSSYVERLTQGQIDLGIGWNGGVARAARNAAKKGVEIKYFVPPKNGFFWVTTWGIPASAPHPVAAHAWINFLLDPENAAIQWNFTGYPRPVNGAIDHVEQAIVKDPSLNIPEETLSTYQSAISSPKVNKLRSRTYARFQSA